MQDQICDEPRYAKVPFVDESLNSLFSNQNGTKLYLNYTKLHRIEINCNLKLRSLGRIPMPNFILVLLLV